jgi:hypothetical protein
MLQQHDVGLVIGRLARVCEATASSLSLQSTQELLLCALPETLSSQLLSAAYDVGLELLVGCSSGGFFSRSCAEDGIQSCTASHTYIRTATRKR